MGRRSITATVVRSLVVLCFNTIQYYGVCIRTPKWHLTCQSDMLTKLISN